MNLTKLHLDEAVRLAIPKNYKEIILGREEFSSELKGTTVNGFGRGESWGRMNNWWHCKPYYDDGNYLFSVSVREKNISEKNIDQYDNILHYTLDFRAESRLLQSLASYIRQWGKQNKIKGQFSFIMGSWLEQQCYANSFYKNVFTEFSCGWKDTIEIIANDEDVFFQLLKDISTAFRTLAEEIDNKNDTPLLYSESDLKDKEYWDLANEILTPTITAGLIAGIKTFRKNIESGETSETVISIEIQKKDLLKKNSMLFYYGDECNGKPFFEFEIGKVLTKCISLMKEENLVYKQELSHWFEDAIPNVPKDIYKGLELTIEIPEVGGDPYLENFD